MATGKAEIAVSPPVPFTVSLDLLRSLLEYRKPPEGPTVAIPCKIWCLQ